MGDGFGFNVGYFGGVVIGFTVYIPVWGVP